MNKYVILDIDETLVYSRSRLSHSVPVEWDGTVDYTTVRPGSHEFIKKLKDKGYKVISVTQGVVPFQTEVLRAVGLLDLFEDICGWETIHRRSVKYPKITADDKFVMVDNLSHEELYEKEKWIGFDFDPRFNFIRCDEFRGDPDSTGLDKHFDRIVELLDGTS